MVSTEKKNGWYRVNMKPGNTNGEILVERRKEEKYLPILRFSQTPTVEADFELLNFYLCKISGCIIYQKKSSRASADRKEVLR